MKEIWKDIEGYGGAYQISNQGRVYCRESYVIGFGGKTRKKPHILKDADNGKGYRYVTISVSKKRNNHYVHRLVAEFFLPNPKNLPVVNHINGNKADNRVENLEWCTQADNLAHAVATGLIGVGGRVHNSIKVIDLSTNIIFECIRDAARERGLHYGTLKDALRHKSEYKGLRKLLGV